MGFVQGRLGRLLHMKHFSQHRKDRPIIRVDLHQIRHVVPPLFHDLQILHIRRGIAFRQLAFGQIQAVLHPNPYVAPHYRAGSNKVGLKSPRRKDGPLVVITKQQYDWQTTP